MRLVGAGIVGGLIASFATHRFNLDREHQAVAWDRDALLARFGDASKRLRLPADTLRARRSSKFGSDVHSRRRRRYPAEGEP
jgi:hypothetical protein